MGRKSKEQLAKEAKAVEKAALRQAAKQQAADRLGKQRSEERRVEIERDAREKKEKGKAKVGLDRAKAHLLDYALQLEKDEMTAMAAEIRETAEGLSLPTMLLGFSVAYRYTMKVAGDTEAKQWVSVTEHPNGR